MIGLTKIVSGGQTGVDQAALRAALKAGLAIGGWCPPGRICDGAPGDAVGRIPAEFPLVETPEDRSRRALGVPRSLRTEWNVRDADATLILHWVREGVAEAPVDRGTAWTAVCTTFVERPLLVADPGNAASAARVCGWLAALAIRTLNVAGPSERCAAGIGDAAEAFLTPIFMQCHNPVAPS